MEGKNRIVALLLCVFGFIFGLHHFYLGNWKKGLLFFITAGGVGIWWAYDIIKLLADKEYVNKYKTCTSFSEELRNDIKINEENRIRTIDAKREQASKPVCCPKCGCSSITAQKKGFSLGKAVVGGAVIAPVAGVFTGAMGKNKIYITCLNCGHKWKPRK